MCRSTRHDLEGGGGKGGDTNPFRDVQYPERTERQFGVGVKRDGSVQHGRWGVSGEKNDDRDLHPGIGLVQGHCDAGTVMTPRRNRAVLQGLYQLFS